MRFNSFTSSLILFLSLLVSETIAQTVYFKQEIDFKGKIQSLFVDEEDPKLFVIDSKYLRTFYLKDRASFVRSNLKGFQKKKLLGYSSSEGSDMTLYFEGKDNTFEFVVLKKGYQSLPNGLLNLTISNNEFYLTGLTHNKVFYILTITKNSSVLNFYPFREFVGDSKIMFDLSSQMKGESLYRKLIKTYISSAVFSLSNKPQLEKVDDSIIANKWESINFSKLYSEGSYVNISLDYNEQNTELISISLEDSTFSVTKIPYPGSYCSSGSYKVNNNTNSFIYNDHLYQTRQCPDTIKISLKSLSGDLVKEWIVTEDTERRIPTDYYGLEFLQDMSTKRAIRKISKLNAGIVVQNDSDEFQFLVGGQQEAYELTNYNQGVTETESGWITLAVNNDFEDLDHRVVTSFDKLQNYKNLQYSIKFPYHFKLNRELYFSYYYPYKKFFTIVKAE